MQKVQKDKLLINLQKNQKKFQKDEQYIKIIDRMVLMQKKVQQIKSQLMRKKQQKQKIIQENQIKRKKLKQQRQICQKNNTSNPIISYQLAQSQNYQKGEKKKLQYTKIKRLNTLNVQTINEPKKQNNKKQYGSNKRVQTFKFQKIPNKKRFQTQTQTQSQNNIIKNNTKNQANKNKQKSSIFEQKQSSVIQEIVSQMPQPEGIHNFQQNPYSPRNNKYYVSEIVKAYKDQRSLARQHIIQSLQIMKTLQSTKMPVLTFKQIQQKKIDLKINMKRKYSNKKVLIFDLDETLIHCNDSLSKKYDFKVQIKFNPTTTIQAGVNIRPYAKEILKNLSQYFQIFIFTASQSCYADQVIKTLDPLNEYISHKFYRQHCSLSPQGMFIKDLRIFNIPLSDVVLIDNAAYSYFFQLDNGIPIIPYYHGENDYQLKALEKYLLQLLQENDVRKNNRKTFQLHKYSDYYNTPNKLVEQLYIDS